ncbi:hypothetical protein CF326_g7092 [Tilletia indica]|nr:hypothetical protein CF326_g7092 [Tilletia indica]
MTSQSNPSALASVLSARSKQLRKAGRDRTTGKWWCDCASNGCRAATGQLTTVAERTYYSHKAQDRDSKQGISATNHGSVRCPQLPEQNPQQTSSHLYDADHASAVSADFEHYEGAADFVSDMPVLSDMDASSDIATAPGRLHDDNSETESEADSDFGDGVEAERVLDPGRATLDSADVEDNHELDDSQSSLPTSANSSGRFNTAVVDADPIPQRPYSSVVRRFMVLVTALCVYFGLGREPAGILFTFFSVAVEPLLNPNDPPIPRQLDTVRRHLGILPMLHYYAVCPGCERLERRTSGIGNCPDCHTPLYERPGKPKITFAYQSLVEWLTWLLNQPGVETTIAEWRDRDPDARLRDVWDGSAWRSDLDPQGRVFTDHNLSLLVALGIDWFSPFRSQYTSWHSTGAIMMCILNLPPRLRYRVSSTYIAGCTPGPKEPKATRLGGYLQPMLEELKLLDQGMTICTHTAPNGRLVRLRVAFYSGDTVGRNKVCGFPSHSVRKGEFCGFCSVDFESKVTMFERALQSRDHHQHRLAAERYQRPFASKEDRELHERSTGARDSPLLRLSYWRSVSMSPVDYMHCLELGLAKRLFHRVLIVGEVITPAHLIVIQRGLQTCCVPSSEQAPDQRLGDPGGGSATAAHWSTLARRLLPLLLFVAWRPIISVDGELNYVIKPVDTSANTNSEPDAYQHLSSWPTCSARIGA